MTDKALRAGTRLNSATDIYTIVDAIGSGGFGITYKAYVPAKVRNIMTRAYVAIKEHFPAADCERMSDSASVSCSIAASQRVSDSLKVFIDEARCLQRIAGMHPNIVNVNEVFEANNTAYYVMEYLEGVSLKEYVASKGKLTLSETLSLMMPVVDAVATLHRNKFTHLDIKPANIMLTEDERGCMRPVLIDFGLAKHYNADGSATATLSVSGFSEGYAPIEQYSGITCFSPQVDVYALGATMLYCLTGKVPPRAVELSQSALSALLPADLPAKERRLLMYAMAFQADDRIPTKQFMIELQRVMAECGISPELPHCNFTPPPAPAPARVAPPVQGNFTQMDRTVRSDMSMAPAAVTLPPSPPSAPSAYVGPDPELEIESSTPRWIWVVITVLILAIGAAAYLVYKNMTQSDNSVPVIEEAASVEMETVTPAESGSDRKRTKTVSSNGKLSDGDTTPDLTFHQLSGPVKSCVNQWGATIPFDTDGNWTGNYSDNLGPRVFGRDSQGRIVTEEYNSREYGPGTIRYTWEGDRITSMVDDTRGQSVYYTYNADGSVATQQNYTNGASVELRFYGERYDSHGNWISRKFERTADDGNSVTTKYGSQSRTIRYY